MTDDLKKYCLPSISAPAKLEPPCLSGSKQQQITIHRTNSKAKRRQPNSKPVIHLPYDLPWSVVSRAGLSSARFLLASSISIKDHGKFAASDYRDQIRFHAHRILTPDFPSSHHSCKEKSMICVHQEKRSTHAAYDK